MRAALAFWLLATLATPDLAGALTTKGIEESLTCQCGCGLTVHSCNHLQCGSAIPLKQEIATLVAQELDRDAILAHFRDRYGEKVLAAPTTEGFNLTAWVMPFLAVGIGVGIVLVTVRRWTAPQEDEPSRPPLALDEADRRRLERALDEDGGERR